MQNLSIHNKKFESRLILKKTLNKPKPILALSVVSAFVFSAANPAVASYNFSVRVTNNTGGEVSNVLVKWFAKGTPRPEWCYSVPNLPRGDDHKASCKNSANVQKWQRRLKVTFNCTSGSEVSLYFPRGTKKFYARDHAVSNRDSYSVKLKKSDC